MLTEGVGLPVAQCGICKREVLTHVRLDDDGELGRCCVGCDARLDPLAVRWVDEDDFRVGAAPAATVQKQGCGSGGCGTGACGRP